MANSTHKTGFGPELKVGFGRVFEVDFGCPYIRLGRCVNLGLKDHQNHLLVFKKMSADQSRRWQLIGIKFAAPRGRNLWRARATRDPQRFDPRRPRIHTFPAYDL